MTTTEESPYSPQWLGLREGADAAARSAELLAPLRARLTGAQRTVIRDLGCGTGSMGRWLAGRLPGPQHWIMHDQDPVLLRHAATTMARTAADGTPVTVTTEQRDITRLTADDLAGTDLVTASALLDLLTADEVDRLAGACADAACPALFTLSVIGRVQLTPADPLDGAIAAAFNAHQRRETAGRRLLGPDAADATAEAFTRRGASVQVRPAPWRLGAAQRELTAQWLRGWVGAACEHDPALTERAGAYLDRRLTAAAAGELLAVVGHSDLLAVPAGAARAVP
jgi:hypothetical protein